MPNSMFMISYALIGNLFSNILMILIGIYSILLFGGFISPKHKNEVQQQRFEEYKQKWGTFILFTGGMLILLGLIQALFTLGFFNY